MTRGKKKAKKTAKKTTKKATKKTATRKTTKKTSAVQFGYLGQTLKHQNSNIKAHHFIGVSLGGGKTDKTCVALVDYYPDQNKIFLNRLFEKIESEGEVSSDLMVHRIISKLPAKVERVAFDVPLQLPKCVRCQLKCPGFEECKEEEIQWLWKHYRKRNASKRPKKLFTPYTERCVEFYMQTELEEVFHPDHALGSNMAPLTARAHFITRRLKAPVSEVYAKLSLWRIGRSLNIQKSHLRFHRHAFGGKESRKAILERLIDKDIAFLYVQDVRAMTENAHSFEAFLCALTAVLSFKGLCEPRPRGFPKSEGWVDIPKQDLDW